ncbi:hypothetical protein BH09GEM1_BH09GEM1_32940 [soil metagenome]
MTAPRSERHTQNRAVARFTDPSHPDCLGYRYLDDRDYTSNASVQVMLFKDRLEIWNPGFLPPTLTLEKLKGAHPSVPANPLIAEPMYLTKYIERMGTGIRDMIDRCRAAGLPEPEIRVEGGMWMTTIRRVVATSDVAPEVTPEVAPEVAPEVRLLKVMSGEQSRQALQDALGLRDDEHFRKAYLLPALENGLIEMTIPRKPRSRLQKYRLTTAGKAALESWKARHQP